MTVIKYRLFEPRLAPRRTRSEVPGWTGQKEPRRDGSHEQAWHCLPFIEGAQAGIEVFYPYDNALRVTRRDNKVILDGDFRRDTTIQILHRGTYVKRIRNKSSRRDAGRISGVGTPRRTA